MFTIFAFFIILIPVIIFTAGAIISLQNELRVCKKQLQTFGQCIIDIEEAVSLAENYDPECENQYKQLIMTTRIYYGIPISPSNAVRRIRHLLKALEQDLPSKEEEQDE